MEEAPAKTNCKRKLKGKGINGCVFRKTGFRKEIA